jgi:hypothetical protein
MRAPLSRRLRRSLSVRSLAALVAATGLAAPVAAEQLNVSKIATGTFTSINWTVEAQQPLANNGAALAYFDLATGSIDTEPTPYFATPPWSALFLPFPTLPWLQRLTPTVPYMDGKSTFTYANSNSRLTRVNMLAIPTKHVLSESFGSGTVAAAVSYTVRIEHTGSDPLDYFVDLQVPADTRTAAPGYDLCCPGDPNGGTYTYHQPKAAQARGAIDLYANGLPVWTNEDTYLYPGLPNSSPFDHIDFLWGKAAGPATTTLFLGRLHSGDTLTVTEIVHSDVQANAPDCGIEGPFGFYPNFDYTVHCLELRQDIQMQSGGVAQPVGFNVYSRVPPAVIGRAP